jgi:HAD superfamily hydrolase (TIGR01509 family)
MNNKLTNLLLDCDGVIVNSEEVGQQAELGVLGSIGLKLTQQEYRELVLGYPEEEHLSRLDDRIKESGISISTDELQAKLKAARWSGYESRLRAIPGMEDIIKEHLLKLAVVSSSDFESVRKKLDLAGLTYVSDDKIFSIQGDHETKAATYLAAIRALGANPNSCIAIEDSKLGVAAAADAEVEVWGLVPSTEEDGFDLTKELSSAGASQVFSDISQLRSALNNRLF